MEFTAETNRHRRDQELQTEQQRRALVEVTRRHEGLIEAIADGLRTPGLKNKLEELEHRKPALESEVSAEPPTPPRLHPNLAELYRRKVADLEQALQDPALRDEALTILRGLVESVELHPTKDRFDIEFKGQITNMINLSAPARRRNTDHFVISAKRVAGARNRRDPGTVRVEV